MSTRLPTLKAVQAMVALGKAGFVVARSPGSHHRLVHPDDPTRATTVPVHKGPRFAASVPARHPETSASHNR